MTLIAKRKTTETITWIPMNAHFYNPVSCPVNLYLTHYEKVEMSKPLGQQLYELVNKTQFSHGDLEPKEMHEWERMAQQFLSSKDNRTEDKVVPDPPEQVPVDEMTSIQEQIYEWAMEQFGPNISKWTGQRLGSLASFLGMVEEIGEMAHAILYRHQGRGFNTDEEYQAAIEDGLADLDVFACDFANREGINRVKNLAKVWEKVSKRRQKTWLKDKEKEEQPGESKELLTSEEIQEELSDRPVVPEYARVSCYAICPNCGSKKIDGESSYPSYKCVDCDHCFDHVDNLAKSEPQYEQNGHGWSEPPEDSEEGDSHNLKHELYEKGDEGVPQSIQDSNGDIALGLCKVCGRGEIELEYDNGVCPGYPVDSKPSDIPGGSSEHRHGEGFFLSKEDIDKVLKDTDSFAMKDFPGFPERPMTFDEMGGPVGNGRRVVIDRGDDSKYDLEFWNPFDAARNIADCYAEGQNKGAAYRTIESLENQFNVERCKKLMLAGMAAIRAAGMDLETATLDEVLAFIEVTEE